MVHKIIAIHQPNFLPWAGYFNKIANSDVFILLNHVEYTKNGPINRNKIKINCAEHFITVPVKMDSSKSAIDEVKISDSKQLQKIWKTIEQNYKKSTYFEALQDDFKKILLDEYVFLADLNIALIKHIISVLDISTSLVKSSELYKNEVLQKNELIVDIIKKQQGTLYISGHGAKKYNDENLFDNNHIKLVYQQFLVPSYPQLGEGFIEKLSIIDMLFNIGIHNTSKIIKQNCLPQGLI